MIENIQLKKLKEQFPWNLWRSDKKNLKAMYNGLKINGST